ncbi:MAG: cysteine desulfurase [Treponema sp.]|jgi:cysteine desulfurase|nr:cysteine desulfurase [Treponema sp.]
MKRHYFDWASTALTDDSSTAQSAPFGNPSSLHMEGRVAKAALEHARARCAAVLGVHADTLYFTSGGTEANAIALYAALLRYRPGTILFSAVEHPSVQENCVILERLGKRTAPIRVDQNGVVTEECLKAALEKHPDAHIAAIMAVQNEIGSINDIAKLSHCVKNRRAVHLHCDMVQALGKIPFSIAESDADSASMSAHKIGGPRGIGLLYLRKPFSPLYRGGGQERGVRPGTENTAGALAFAERLERRYNKETITTEYECAEKRIAHLIDFLKSTERCRLIPENRVPFDHRFSPFIVQVRFTGIPGEVSVRMLDDAGFAVSTGSACSSAKNERPVLLAMGEDAASRTEGVRISQGWSTTDHDIEALISAIKQILKRY